jgi:quercetin dioxygenase-like cupin family protein
VEFGAYDTTEFADELNGASENHEIATRLLFENERVRIWELSLEPGERAPFHCHAVPYFFVCVDGGQALSRFTNGTTVSMEYAVGDTWFDEMANGFEVHDLENVGSTRLRFTTVELLGG